MPQFLEVNPSRQRKGSASRAARPKARKSKNPAAGVLLSMANPKRKHRTAAQKAAFKRMLAARSKNPSVKVVTRYRNKTHKARARRCNPSRRSRNPFNVAGFGAKQIAIGGVSAFAGGLATRKLTSVVLGTSGNNKGFMGYGLNLVFAIAGGLLLARWSPAAGAGWAFGGVGTTAQRFYDEHMSPVRKVLALAMTQGESDGKGMGDISYDDWAVSALQGYYNTAYVARSTVMDELGAPVVPIAPPHAAMHYA
jgi:hypothetical protein